MKKATKIRVKTKYSESLTEIDSIYIEGDGCNGLYKKEILYDKIEFEGWVIEVDKYPYPRISVGVNMDAEKYVKSIPDKRGVDLLFKLPII